MLTSFSFSHVLEVDFKFLLAIKFLHLLFMKYHIGFLDYTTLEQIANNIHRVFNN